MKISERYNISFGDFAEAILKIVSGKKIAAIKILRAADENVSMSLRFSKHLADELESMVSEVTTLNGIANLHASLRGILLDVERELVESALDYFATTIRNAAADDSREVLPTTVAAALARYQAEVADYL